MPTRDAEALRGIREAELAHHSYVSLSQGRCKTTPVLTLAGLQGGESKSPIFYPLPAMFGDENGAASALPIEIQLLWFESKPMPLARPQGEHISHLLYKGSAHIFLTTPLKRLGKLLEEAESARASGSSWGASMLVRRLKVHRFIGGFLKDLFSPRRPIFILLISIQKWSP